MAIRAQRSIANHLPGLRKGAAPLRAPANDNASHEEHAKLARLRSVLSSAYYHAHATERHDGAPYPFKHLELEEIAEYFAKHPHPALQRFVAALLLDNPRPELDSVIDRLLGAHYAQRVRTELDAQAKQRPLTPSGDWQLGAAPLETWGPKQHGRTHPAYRGPNRFAFAYEQLTRMAHADQGTPQQMLTFNGAAPLARPVRRGAAAQRGPESPDALPTDLDVFWEYDPVEQITSVRAEVTVKRQPSEYVLIADPQNWQDAAFLFFQCSELVELVGGEYVPLSHPPAPGTASYHQLLHEIVSISFNPFIPMRGSNVLVVDYDHGNADGCGMVCSLFSSLTTVVGASYEKGGLDVDGGTFQAVRIDAEHTRLISSKQVRFTERELCGLTLGKSLNEFAPFWLVPWIALLTFEAGKA
jgi:hypothetical protein